jgi:4'-phosphopantetheinyl transferase
MGNSFPWVHAAAPLALADKELHLWRAQLDLPSALLRRMASTLSGDEKERAERFLIAQAGERFVAARGILRHLLGMYSGVNPASVEFRYGPEGKPSLSTIHSSNISFSVSHSGKMALFAVCGSAELGVDIEEVKSDFKGMQIASHFFSEEEVAELSKLPPKLADQAFFECWTAKEAYVKARGQGLSIPLRSFTVGFGCREQLLQVEGGSRWSCYALEPALGFAGAVVAAGEGWSLRRYEWPAEIESQRFGRCAKANYRTRADGKSAT